MTDILLLAICVGLAAIGCELRLIRLALGEIAKHMRKDWMEEK